MTTINETIDQSLRNAGLSNYRRQAEPVVNALVEREQRIFTGIVDAGAALGGDRNQIAQALRDLGVEAPPVQAAVAAGADDDLAARVARLEQFARDRVGYTP